MIDQEVRSIVDECYEKATQLLAENEDKLRKMAEALVEYETINSDQLDDIMAGAKPRAPDNLPPPSVSKPDGDDKESPIGGPAEDH